MMSLEQAIKHFKESEKMNKNVAEHCVSVLAKNHNLENAEKCRRMIEWLRELQERRKEPEIIYCHECIRRRKNTETGEYYCRASGLRNTDYDFVQVVSVRRGEPMSKCKDCKYAGDGSYEISGIECCTCSLTRMVMNANAESNCNCFNRDLSEYDICYNCKYYGGGGDWGLFCSHKDMYHHLGKFSDTPCKRYERRTDGQRTGG